MRGMTEHRNLQLQAFSDATWDAAYQNDAESLSCPAETVATTSTTESKKRERAFRKRERRGRQLIMTTRRA